MLNRVFPLDALRFACSASYCSRGGILALDPLFFMSSDLGKRLNGVERIGSFYFGGVKHNCGVATPAWRMRVLFFHLNSI